MKYRNNIISILIISLTLLAGCDTLSEYDENAVAIGKFKVNVKGYFNKTFSGRAIYETVLLGRNDSLFILKLVNKYMVVPELMYCYVEFLFALKPNVGEYNIGSFLSINGSKLRRISATYNDSEYNGSYSYTGGKLEISSSNNNILKGKFSFKADNLIPKNNGEFSKAEITVTGEFYAEEGDTGLILN